MPPISSESSPVFLLELVSVHPRCEKLKTAISSSCLHLVNACTLKAMPILFRFLSCLALN